MNPKSNADVIDRSFFEKYVNEINATKQKRKIF